MSDNTFNNTLKGLATFFVAAMVLKSCSGNPEDLEPAGLTLVRSGVQDLEQLQAAIVGINVRAETNTLMEEDCQKAKEIAESAIHESGEIEANLSSLFAKEMINQVTYNRFADAVHNPLATIRDRQERIAAVCAHPVTEPVVVPSREGGALPWYEKAENAPAYLYEPQ